LIALSHTQKINSQRNGNTPDAHNPKTLKLLLSQSKWLQFTWTDREYC